MNSQNHYSTAATTARLQQDFQRQLDALLANRSEEVKYRRRRERLAKMLKKAPTT